MARLEEARLRIVDIVSVCAGLAVRQGTLVALRRLPCARGRVSCIHTVSWSNALCCVAKQLATSDTGDSTRDETPAQPEPIDAPPASVDHAAPSTSAGDGSGGEDAFVRQLQEQLSVDQQGTRQAGRSDATNEH